jgi:hypothetical protein
MFDADIQPINETSDSVSRVWTRLKPISKSKYPAIDVDEATHSLPLQALCLAIFDAIMVRQAPFSSGSAHRFCGQMRVTRNWRCH